jgi:hypothetical protein
VKDERVYLGHIRDAINDIEGYTSAGRDTFLAERMRQDAVIRARIQAQSFHAKIAVPPERPFTECSEICMRPHRTRVQKLTMSDPPRKSA